jgi:hypothetical protein
LIKDKNNINGNEVDIKYEKINELNIGKLEYE